VSVAGRVASVGRGLLAVALLPAALLAQRTPPDSAAIPIPPRPDSLPTDTLARPDTVARDTAMTPLARAPRPTSLAVGGDYAWDRDAILSTGAASLLDLLERVPGVTAYRVGWLVTPEHAAYGGAFGRIRVFYDGVELDALHPRTGGLPDLSRIELWTLEEVAVERAPGELRVHLRSWRVERTTPYTRVDVGTGELETNLFRGYFGRRFRNGAAVQGGFQQFSTEDPQLDGDGDQLAIFARVGWAEGPWSADATARRTSRFQTLRERRFPERGGLPELETTRTFAYLRGGYRDPAAEGVWAQLVASTQSLEERSAFRPELGLAPSDSADTTRSRPQYVATAGLNRGPLSLSAIARLRSGDDGTAFSPAARGAFRVGLLELQGYAERSGEDSTLRADAELRFTPRANLSASAGVSRLAPDGETGRPTVTAFRGEAGVRLGRTWVVGGAIARRGDATPAPVVFDPDFVAASLGTVTGVFGAVRGPVWRDLSAEVVATQWSGGDAAYRPDQQVRAQLTLDTRWLSRFPTGEFGFKLSGAIEHRSGATFPGAGGVSTLASTVVGAVVEIRIQDAIAFLQSRNTLAVDYEQVPGYLLPRNLIVYGVRWQFWN
jgi:hypothetical protein